MSKDVPLKIVLDGLMRRYIDRVPDVQLVNGFLIRDGLIKSKEDIENDHVAFRTLGVENLGIASLEKVFLHLGYEKRDYYNFAAKKLNAYWYAPPANNFPRIFISELRVNELSDEAQRIIYSYTDEVKADPTEAIDLDNPAEVDHFLHHSLWRIPLLKDYERLKAESEFASWVIYNRYYLNHYTISVHNLPEGCNTIALFNDYVEKRGIKLNDAGGKIKVSSDGLLIQSSTVAELVDAIFYDEQGNKVTKKISGSYVEFAERKILPEYQHVESGQVLREHRRDGFDPGNANNIFESTYSKQIEKRR